MCGHATVGALWALRQWRLWTRPGAVVQTLSGRVDVHWDDRLQQVWISQPRATWTALAQAQRAQIAAVLGLDPSGPLPPMANAATSRVKTLVRLDSVAQLQALRPDFAGMHALCDAIGSTGLYPYALGDGAQDNGVVLFARQFPRASGYPEDAATGIAAAALWGHLAGTGRIDAGTPQAPATCVVRQGDAMGQPSAIEVQARFDPWGAVQGCWIGGRVDWAAP